MKIELTDKFEDIEVKRILYGQLQATPAPIPLQLTLPYTPHPLRMTPQEDFEEYVRDSTAIEQEMGLNRRPFKSKNDKFITILQSYGPSAVIVEYICDNFVHWKGSQVIRAFVKNGAQAQRFLEYCIDRYSLGLPEIPEDYSEQGIQTQPPSPTSFEDVPFGIWESLDAKKILLLIAGANIPQFSVRAGYRIFVDEQKGEQKRELTSFLETPAWYTHLFNVFPLRKNEL